jgi:hypothetical protein
MSQKEAARAGKWARTAPPRGRLDAEMMDGSDPAMALKAFMGMRMFRRLNIPRAVRKLFPGRHHELDP